MTDARALPVYRRLWRSDFLRHGALVFLASNLANALAYAFHFIASRALGVQEYGTLSSLIAVIAIAGFPASIVSMISVKYAAELRGAQDAGKVRALLGAALRFTVLGGAVMLIGGIALSGPLAAFLHVRSVWAVGAAAGLIAVGFVVSSLRGIVLGIQDFRGYALTVAAEAVVKLVASIGLIEAGFGTLGAVGGFIAGALVALLACWPSLAPYLRASREAFHVDVRRLVQSTLGVALGMGALIVLTSLDMVLAKHYLDQRDAGYYGVLAQTGKILTLLAAFIPVLVLPKATARAAEGRSALGVLANALGLCAVLLGAGLTAFFFVPKLLVTMLGGMAFAPAAPYVFQYGIAMAGLALLNVVTYYKISVHRFDFVIPLLLAVAGEAVAVAFWHRDIAQIVHVLIVVNYVSLCGCLLNLNPARTHTAERSQHELLGVS